jgi:cobalt-precorrin 5A hydrolase
MKLAIIAITEGGAKLARTLGTAAEDAEVYLPERLRRADNCRYFSRPLAIELPALFAGYQGLLCIMATGIVVRLLAPHLRGKDTDPAVVVMDEKGDFAVSLLSGHLGGANDLARAAAELTGGQAVITTATDVNDLPAWDDVARQEGMGIEPLPSIKVLNALLLRGEPIALVDRGGRVAAHFGSVATVSCHGNFAQALGSGAAGQVFVTHRHIPWPSDQGILLLLRPRDLVVGIGCNRGTAAGEIEEAVKKELSAAFLAFGSIASLATIEAKGDEAGLLEFARLYRFRLDLHSAAALNAVVAPSAESSHALAAVGARGVCEPAALLSAGGGPLLVNKKKCGNVTVAVAQRGDG